MKFSGGSPLKLCKMHGRTIWPPRIALYILLANFHPILENLKMNLYINFWLFSKDGLRKQIIQYRSKFKALTLNRPRLWQTSLYIYLSIGMLCRIVAQIVKYARHGSRNKLGIFGPVRCTREVGVYGENNL